MEAASYNLSLIPEDGQEWTGSKGWSVYTIQDGKKTEMIPDSFGCYSPLQYAEQTFYYSRLLKEDLDSPTLQIGVANRSISVFLDDDVIYTDWPELDNRIGHLTLPMLEYDRAEPVTISLPPDYMGKTLTIAQSTPKAGYSEKPDVDPNYFEPTVFPCNVRLYCGYAYESGLISGTTKTILPAALLFGLILCILAAFLWNASLGIIRLPLLLFGITVFFQMCSILAQAEFFFQYFRDPPLDPVYQFLYLSIAALLAFLTTYGGKRRPVFLVLTIVQLLLTLLSAAMEAGLLLPYGDARVTIMSFPQIWGLLALIIAVILGVQGRKQSSFFQHFSQSAVVLTVGYALFILISIPLSPGYASSVFQRVLGEITLLLPKFSLLLMWRLCLISSLFAVIYDQLEQEAQRRSEAVILAEKHTLAMESYENLHRQSQEVQMLRHDTMRHYTMLSRMASETPEKLTEYLNNLIDRTAHVRPVVTSGNQILDIILNGKLNAAAEKGIATELIRAEAPETLPLTDPDACSLFMNILDNAIQAASAPDTATPYIHLDFHCKNQHFIFICENSVSENQANENKTPMPGHGYGLKIIYQIMGQWKDMVFVESTKTSYKISLILPLN